MALGCGVQPRGEADPCGRETGRKPGSTHCADGVEKHGLERPLGVDDSKLVRLAGSARARASGLSQYAGERNSRGRVVRKALTEGWRDSAGRHGATFVIDLARTPAVLLLRLLYDVGLRFLFRVPCHW